MDDLVKNLRNDGDKRFKYTRRTFGDGDVFWRKLTRHFLSDLSTETETGIGKGAADVELTVHFFILYFIFVPISSILFLNSSSL